jgi:hypothetical protein
MGNSDHYTRRVHGKTTEVLNFYPIHITLGADDAVPWRVIHANEGNETPRGANIFRVCMDSQETAAIVYVLM